ncbi:uncharacterized protein [Miscanthus floridulus]|uniref:uncharacterized protein n=1 Tax=Miscanthus floridulus TaxID=154761 RepID=UPI00345946BC
MHPRANGQAKHANNMILDVLKKRLYKNEQKHPGSEAILLANIAFQALRVENYNEEYFNQARLIELDNLEEERLVSCVWTVKYLDSMRRYYNRNVNDRFFMVGDLVLRKKQKTNRMHKLSSP